MLAMPVPQNARWLTLVGMNVLGVCLLGLYSSTQAAPRESNEPFANAVQQRAETIELLRSIDGHLKEQNALLRSGTLKVVVTESKK
jgi:hypothetical protein